jgi:hypothetical protein
MDHSNAELMEWQEWGAAEGGTGAAGAGWEGFAHCTVLGVG